MTLVGLTHCAGVGPEVQEVRLREGAACRPPPGQADQIYSCVHSSSVASGHRLGQRLHSQPRRPCFLALAWNALPHRQSAAGNRSLGFLLVKGPCW